MPPPAAEGPANPRPAEPLVARVTVTSGYGPADCVTPPSLRVAASWAGVILAASTVTASSAPCWSANPL